MAEPVGPEHDLDLELPRPPEPTLMYEAAAVDDYVDRVEVTLAGLREALGHLPPATRDDGHGAEASDDPFDGFLEALHDQP